MHPLRAATPSQWVDEAVRCWPELLADHANCEKKAASTALALMFAYPEALLQAESDEQARLLGSPNQLEAVRAHLAARAPSFVDPPAGLSGG